MSKSKRELRLAQKREYSRRRYIENPERECARARKWYHENKERARANAEAWKTANPNYQRDYQRRVRATIRGTLLNRLRSRLSQAMAGRTRSLGTMQLLGCSLEEFVQHIENQFKSGMSWNNYSEWEIDHVKPLSLFNLADGGQLREAMSLINIQPLWRSENRRKSNKYLDRERRQTT